MHHYWHVILESLIDTAKILPFLFIVYYLIELLEFKWAFKIQNNKWLKGKGSPLFGSMLGCVPQCGFSVISTDLYSKGAISVGALLAVYIATSDEAFPLMVANPKSLPWLIALIGVKIVMGILVGYLSILLYKIFFKKRNIENIVRTIDQKHEHNEDEQEFELSHGGCCHHHVEAKSFDWLHPMLHCLKISSFIFFNIF